MTIYNMAEGYYGGMIPLGSGKHGLNPLAHHRIAGIMPAVFRVIYQKPSVNAGQAASNLWQARGPAPTIYDS
jgi:hypothetical protein